MHKQKQTQMAKPIKDTPILTGKDAIKFQSEITASKNFRVSSNERERMIKNFQALNAIVKK